MSNNLVLFDVKGGFLIDGKVAVLHGTGAPSGPEIDKVGIGSLWLSESDGSVFKKFNLATGPQSWSRITESAGKSSTVEGITEETVLDQEYTAGTNALNWSILIQETDRPEARRYSTLSSVHNGTSDLEAENVVFEEHSVLYTAETSNTLVASEVAVKLFGTYPNQVMELSVTPPPGVKVDVTVARLSRVPDMNNVSVPFQNATESIIGLVRLASNVKVGTGEGDEVITISNLKNRLDKMLRAEHSDVQIVVDPTVKVYEFTYNPLHVFVFLNRLKLRKTEYEATNGTDIRLILDLELNDEIEVVTIPAW